MAPTAGGWTVDVMYSVLVEVLHDGGGALVAVALEEVTGDGAAGEGDETPDEDDEETAGGGDVAAGDDTVDEYDETAGVGDATTVEDDELAEEDDDTTDEGDETTAAGATAAEDVPKISFCAPSLNPHLLLYAGLLGLPLWSKPLTAMLFPSA